MSRLRLPIGIQSFSEIRTQGYAYVDKTPFIADLVNRGKYFFLSRPRRFGKSLFVDTLDCAFSGRRDLFTNLYLDSPEAEWNFSNISPVIRISLGQRINKTALELKDYFTYIISDEAERFQIKIDPALSPGFQLDHLTKALFKATGRQVVILIDEYDRPILDNIENPHLAGELREELKSFYSVVKDLDPYIRFFFMTGVSKFAKTGIFSGLNNLKDITLHSQFSPICGYTQNDLETVFADWICGLDTSAIKEWYNGYAWTGESVYNPFDILLLLDERVFKPYWFETGTPTFLIKLWLSKPRFPADYDGLVVGDEIISSFDSDNLRPETLLFQAGYLTIRSWVSNSDEGTWYTLGFPNREVREAFNRQILLILQKDSSNVSLRALRNTLESGDTEALKEQIHAFFASIPHDWYRNNPISRYEGYYATVLYTYFASLGYEIIPEDTTNKGRVDLTVKTKTRIWVFEFKVQGLDKTGDASPLAQIRQKRYAEKYQSDPRYVYQVGIVFDPLQRNIVSWEVA